MSKKVILGIDSIFLSQSEKELFSQFPPYGVILFKRNCDNPSQLKDLISSIKEVIPECKILIDQEGGRVARLREPNFKEFPPANSLNTKELAYDNYFIMGKYLKNLGIDVNCAPVADLYYSYADKIIGDRSFGEDVDHVVDLVKASAQGLMDSGVIPIIKHIPGHGRALVDSHKELPIVKTDLETLEKSDFLVFKKLSGLPVAMTAHVIYEALDRNDPISISKPSIDYIRKNIGFSGLLISDDINMKALSGDLGELAKKILAAGCDIVLHCSGNLEEMKKILNSI